MSRTADEWRTICERITCAPVHPQGKRAVYDSGVEFAQRHLRPLDLPPDALIVELGSGNGRVPMGLCNWNKELRYVGFDCQPECVAFCREAFAPWKDRFAFYQIDTLNQRYNPRGRTAAESVAFPLADASADLVVCCSVFTHLGSRRAADRYLSEAARILKPGGVLWSSWFRSPPNSESESAARTVYPESWIRGSLRGFEITSEEKGLTTGHHDQWCIVARRTERPRLPSGSGRGRIQSYLLANALLLRPPVLEIGSRLDDPAAWWADNRHLCRGQWIGVDAQPGTNVDLVTDAESLSLPDASVGSVVCSEVLEHTRRPWRVIAEAYRVLQPGGWLLLTTPFCHPLHNCPHDYWRLTPECVGRLLADAGFREAAVETDGEIGFVLNDHGEPGFKRQSAPMHVFARAQKPDCQSTDYPGNPSPGRNNRSLACVGFVK